MAIFLGFYGFASHIFKMIVDGEYMPSIETVLVILTAYPLQFTGSNQTPRRFCPLNFNRERLTSYCQRRNSLIHPGGSKDRCQLWKLFLGFCLIVAYGCVYSKFVA